MICKICFSCQSEREIIACTTCNNIITSCEYEPKAYYLVCFSTSTRSKFSNEITPEWANYGNIQQNYSAIYVPFAFSNAPQTSKLRSRWARNVIIFFRQRILLFTSKRAKFPKVLIAKFPNKCLLQTLSSSTIINIFYPIVSKRFYLTAVKCKWFFCVSGLK